MSGTWKFNDGVAENFDTIAQTSIPNYEVVIQKCLLIAQKAFPDPEAKIIDVGSAMGHTMEVFRNAGYRNVFGVDNSPAMIEKSRVRENLILSDSFPIEAGPFDLILANWTLHFVKERKEYLADILRSLAPGGMLVLSEKTLTSGFVHDRYHDFKRSQGLSEQQIADKMRSIEGVLVPLPLQWYFDTLAEVGFQKAELIDASWCFATLVAYA